MVGLLRKLLLLVMLLAVTGGQWAALQSAAWAGMLVHHLRTESISSAMSNTFDGNHPCPLCKAIERGKKSEKSADFDPSAVRMEFITTQNEAAPGDDDRLRGTVCAINEFAESMITPPLMRPPALS